MSLPDEVKKKIESHVERAKRANTHPGRLMVLSRLLEELFGVKLEELLPGIEKELGSKLWGLRGRADLIFSNVVFEVKVDLSKELDDAQQKLKKYLQALHERRPRERSIGIATDCIEFVAYAPVLKDGKVVDLKEVGSLDIAKSPYDGFLWLDSFIFSQPRIEPSAQDLRWRFGPGSPTYSMAVEALRSLWNKVKGERDARLKLDLWAKNMEIVYGRRPKLDSFIAHTYLVTLVKLVVYLVLSGDDKVRKDRIKEALTGEYFSRYGLASLIEEDFFAWIMHPKVSDEALELFCGIAKELLRYDFSKIDEDFFKEIYQEIVERGVRRRIGEYYTPEWLAKLVLEEAVRLWMEKRGERSFPRILDPACGSGTFLCNAIRMAVEELSSKGEPWHQILDFIVNNVVGVDVNPLAAVIARANYVIALRGLIRSGKPKSIVIPVYVADSIRIPEVKRTLVANCPVYDIEVDGHHIQVPKSVAARVDALSGVLEALRKAVGAYVARRDRGEAFGIFEREARAVLPEGLEEELKVLRSTLGTLLTLVDKGLDSIWIFMLKNVYAPVALTESKFDVVVGNPPWIAMRYIENKEYQNFLKDLVVFDYGLLDSSQVNLFTHIEMATLFFCRSSDLYLKDGGIIAFVMPRSVLTGALHHASFKKFERPKMKLIEIFDLEKVRPLFNVPSCALFARRGKGTSYPVPAKRFSGKLPKKNAKLDEAMKYLSTEEYMYEPPRAPLKFSDYYDYVKEGAIICPRCFFFVDFDVHPILGVDVSKPAVKSSEEMKMWEKEPWKGISLSGNVESDFVYVTLLSKDLVPFGYVKLRPIVLPVEQTSAGYRLLNVDELRNRGYTHMAAWLERAQEYWSQLSSERAKESFPNLIDYIDYQGKLTKYQRPDKRYAVIYNSSGAHLVSCVIDKQALPPFRLGHASIKPTNFVADSKTYLYETDSELEAHYLCAILNSSVVNEGIKPLQTKGLFGPRDIGRRPFMLPIPKFDSSNELHLRLAKLSIECHRKVSQLRFTKKSTAGLRREARKAIEKEIAEIDSIVSQLLP